MHKPQQGYVLLVMMALVLSAGLGLFVTTLGKSVVAHQAAKNRDVMVQLQNVKRRLLGYAATYPEIYSTDWVGPGFLPCPDTDKDGAPEPPCSELAIGWMPQMISGENINFMAEALDPDRVLLVLDSRFANNTAAASCHSSQRRESVRCVPLNGDTPADQLSLNNRSESYIALLIYAGRNLGDQRRGASTDIADYLEGENADGDSDFSSMQSDSQNDLILGITHDEWATAMRSRVLVDVTDSNWCSTSVTPEDWYTDHEWADDSVINEYCTGTP